jgi:gamma-glutamyltranspeptidase/glutathione hydrolase
VPQAKHFPRAGVASPHYLASAAGLSILARGGNAIDAAVATSLTLGVVAPYFCGYGGDLFAVVWDGELHGYLGSGRSPAALTIDKVRQEQEAMPVLGADTVTVPGAPAGWFALLERWGTLSFGDVSSPARGYAGDGFKVSAAAAEVFAGCALMYAGFAPLLDAYGAVGEGTWLRQPELVRTIEFLAEDGPDGYYRGPAAAGIAGAVQTTGGVLTTADLAAHEGRWATPLRARYRDVEVAELPPPTQGVSALEALRILDGFDLGADGPERQHLLIEATKLALVDRNDYVSDPAVMSRAASDLLEDDWVVRRRAEIDPVRSSTPPPNTAHTGGTAYLCAADEDGLLVSLIQSNFIAMGSGVRVPEWGINLNNRGSSFSLDPARVNALAPSKLPMHTLIPAMSLRDGEPWLVFGSMGGDSQAQIQVQLLAHLIDDAADPQAALDAPRWCIEPSNWQLRAERAFAPEMLEGLVALGHAPQRAHRGDSGMGHAHAITRTRRGYAVATDPRAEGAALGV